MFNRGLKLNNNNKRRQKIQQSRKTTLYYLKGGNRKGFVYISVPCFAISRSSLFLLEVIVDFF